VWELKKGWAWGFLKVESKGQKDQFILWRRFAVKTLERKGRNSFRLRENGRLFREKVSQKAFFSVFLPVGINKKYYGIFP